MTAFSCIVQRAMCTRVGLIYVEPKLEEVLWTNLTLNLKTSRTSSMQPQILEGWKLWGSFLNNRELCHMEKVTESQCLFNMLDYFTCIDPRLSFQIWKKKEGKDSRRSIYIFFHLPHETCSQTNRKSTDFPDRPISLPHPFSSQCNTVL